MRNCYEKVNLDQITIGLISGITRNQREVTKDVLLQNFRFDLFIDTIHNISIFEID